MMDINTPQATLEPSQLKQDKVSQAKSVDMLKDGERMQAQMTLTLHVMEAWVNLLLYLNKELISLN